jgi:hypothetical protein
MHPYSQTFDRSRKSAKILNDKPLVFTEWGGHFVYDNPKLMREFILEMKKLYEKNSDDGALAGAFLWAFAEIKDFNREKPATVEGRLLEGLVDSERNPEMCFQVFREAWEEDINASAPFELTSLSHLDEDVKPLELITYKGNYQKLKDELFGGPKPDFLVEQRPRVIKVGPVFESTKDFDIFSEPLVLSDGEKIKFGGKADVNSVYVLGSVSLSLGYPLSGEYGEMAATVRVTFDDGTVEDYPIRNAIELTTVFKTYRSSRIDPIAERAERFLEFSYDKSFEMYVMNKLEIKFNERKNIRALEIISENNGYAVLTYGVFVK